MGFPEKYLRELEVLRDLGYSDAAILDDIEIIDSTRYESVSSRWGIDQYGLNRKRFSIALYHLMPTTRELHPFAGQAVVEYLHDLLHRYPTLEVLQSSTNIDSYEAAFREARSLGSEYFFLLSVEESERSFTTVLDQYLTGTGKKLRTYKVFRTGNDRVQDNFNILADRVFSAFPLRGVLLARQFDLGVVDLGLYEQLETGQELAIVRKGKVRLQNNSIGVAADQEDILGTFSVGTLDELISEGTVQKKSFFDLINAEDEIIATTQPEESYQSPEEGEPGLLRRILDFVGL
jgi:hypothetical protein